MLTHLTAVAQVAAQTAESHAESGLPPLAYALIIFGGFLSLMFITLAFTSVGKRHPVTDEHPDVYRQHPNKHDHGQASHH